MRPFRSFGSWRKSIKSLYCLFKYEFIFFNFFRLINFYTIKLGSKVAWTLDLHPQLNPSFSPIVFSSNHRFNILSL